ncbi:MAG TPA: type II toxin-antitoxin system PemK/MazF family toxin [Methanomicrobiales archaeon]|nr:type II toxin-antitoxin system PemK/MazF family toxin [Methanomicrobiales archaeon]
MGRYAAGDVVLVPLSMRGGEGRKVRPAVVLSAGEEGILVVLPISSRAPTDSPGIPLDLEDFERGGLDLFERSYVLAACGQTVHTSEVAGKKGSLTPTAFNDISGMAMSRVRRVR